MYVRHQKMFHCSGEYGWLRKTRHIYIYGPATKGLHWGMFIHRGNKLHAPPDAPAVQPPDEHAPPPVPASITAVSIKILPFGQQVHLPLLLAGKRADLVL